VNAKHGDFSGAVQLTPHLGLLALIQVHLQREGKKEKAREKRGQRWSVGV
jgi:hypothetical protein